MFERINSAAVCCTIMKTMLVVGDRLWVVPNYLAAQAREAQARAQMRKDLSKDKRIVRSIIGTIFCGFGGGGGGSRGDGMLLFYVFNAFRTLDFSIVWYLIVFKFELNLVPRSIIATANGLILKFLFFNLMLVYYRLFDTHFLYLNQNEQQYLIPQTCHFTIIFVYALFF